MSSIAQRLCDEIVEPTYSSQHTNEPSSSQYNHRSRTHDGKATKSVYVEKKKVVNKLGPSSTNPSKSIINQYKSKEILMNRRLRDVAVNTLKSGPLTCDHDCITMVRKKDCRKTCRCSNNKNPSKTFVKETQTGGRYDFILSDNKACAQSIETYSRGTQFAESLSSGVMAYTGFGTNTAKPLAAKPDDSQCIKCRMIPVNGEHASKSLCSYSNKAIKCPKYSYMGARRWALSKYPSRGPDF